MKENEKIDLNIEDGNAQLVTGQQAMNVIESQERAQIDMQIATAKRYPRDLVKFKQELLKDVGFDEETAASCFYSLPRGGKVIEGPSTRLAEIAVCHYGNMRVGARIIARTNKTITAQAICHDLQSNVCHTQEVERKICSQKGDKIITFTEDMIVVTGQAACAIAWRNAVFKVIPGAYIRSAYLSARKIAVGDARTFKTRILQAIERLGKMGIREPQILEYLEKRDIDSIDTADLENLFGVMTAIKDGDLKPEEVFVEKTKEVAKPKFDKAAEQLFEESKKTEVKKDEIK